MIRQPQFLFFAASIAFSAGGCATSGQSETSSATNQQPTETTASREQEPGEATKPAREMVRPPDPWVEKRVSEARTRLTSTEAGRIIWKSLEAHGGLARWYSNGPIYFQYHYQPVGDRTARNTFQTIDTWSARARHQMVDDPSREYGWDGQRAWYKPADWEPPYDVRFWALTPYYFMGMPFVLADPGVNLTLEDDDTIEGTDYHVVRVTFGDVGISPDDYYVLYIDKETYRLGALRYIVAYPKYFPKGGHSPEKLMTYDGEQEVGGIIFAESYRFFMWKPNKKTQAEKVTDAWLKKVEFRPDTPDQYFEVPEGAEVVEE